MKSKILTLLIVSIAFFSCGDGGIEEIIPEETVGKSTTVVTGAISTTLEYEAEFLAAIITLEAGSSKLDIYLGNIGQTESVVILNLFELGNKGGFAPGTYNYTGETSDPDLTLYCSGYYADLNTTYNINGAANLTNKIIIKTVTDTKVTGEYELNLEDYNGVKIKLVGSFEAVGVTTRI